jgi:hypothetical protein
VERATPATGRQGWAEALGAATASGAAGLIIPATPGLLDILRKPDAEDDRSDLRIAYG